MPWIKSTLCTLRPASLLWRFMAARASCPVSKASTNCLEMASPKPTLSLQPPHSQPWPPEKNVEKYQITCGIWVKKKRSSNAACIFVQIYFSDLFVRSCCHHSHSCQSPQDCNSWLKCTWPQPSWWRAQTLSPGLLSKERPISSFAGLEFSILERQSLNE